MKTREELEKEYIESYNSKGFIWIVLFLCGGAVITGLSFFVICKFIVEIISKL